MKVSQLVTKIVVRVFFILLFVGAFLFFQSDNSKLSHIYFTFRQPWQMVFPCILILAFISLLLICSVKKYKEADLNWLLVLNTSILIIYAVAVYIRVYHLI